MYTTENSKTVLKCVQTGRGALLISGVIRMYWKEKWVNSAETVGISNSDVRQNSRRPMLGNIFIQWIPFTMYREFCNTIVNHGDSRAELPQCSLVSTMQQELPTSSPKFRSSWANNNFVIKTLLDVAMKTNTSHTHNRQARNFTFYIPKCLEGRKFSQPKLL